MDKIPKLKRGSLAAGIKDTNAHTLKTEQQAKAGNDTTTFIIPVGSIEVPMGHAHWTALPDRCPLYRHVLGHLMDFR